MASVLREERCDPNQMSRAAPLIVDWRGDDRLNLEATMRQGVAVVSYTCDAIKLLPHCRVKGDYGFIGVSTKEEKMSLKDQSEIIANLPLTGSALIARAGGELKQGAGIDVQLVMVGKKRTAISEVIKDHLEGECDGATHFVQGATVGAFVVSTDSRALGKVMAEVFGGGGSASGSSEKASQVVDGRPDHCEKADPMSDAPPSQCQSAMRLDLVKISGVGDAPKVNDGPADGTTHGKDNASCPPGLVFSGGKCTKKASVTADYQCSGKDEGECAAQCQKGNMASCRLQGLLQEDSGKFREALKSYLLACKGGDAISCSNAGYMYRTGRGVDQQDDTAAQLMQIGCEAGDARGCTDLGYYYEKGIGVPGSNERAAQLYKRGCDGGNLTGCANYAYMLNTGTGVAKDHTQAAVYRQRACLAGNARSCSDLGYQYDRGEGVPKDIKRAESLYIKACEGDNGIGCMNAGITLEDGGKDLARAAAFYAKGCKLEAYTACRLLGGMYQTGRGVSQDNAQAKAMFKRACDGGDPDGCKLMDTVGSTAKPAVAPFKSGTRVRATRSYDGKIRAGMTGTYYGTNGGNPPAFVIWDSHIGANPVYYTDEGAPLGKNANAYWVPWDVIERAMTSGMRVQAVRDYDGKITRGMTGTYYGTNGGNPPAFVIWDKQIGANPVYYTAEGAPPGKNAYAYWVEWNVIEEVLRPGTRVVATGNYDGKIKKGMEGVYWGTNGGNPPAFVIWDNTIGANPTYYTGDGAPPGKEKNAYWVPWNLIDLALPNGVRVIATKAYDGKIKRGMMGTYYGTNGKNPPAFVIWDDHIGVSPFYYTGGGAPPGRESYAYWVEWDVIKRAFQPGRKVRAVRDYDGKIRKGMTGVYWGTNGGNPPAFILWDSTIGANPVYYTDEGAPAGKNKNAYWVPWNVVEPINY
ncbi:MAG: sel1 repeat family protein [Polyangiaceae bacterium]|nr:sel1 repeat family protein [Polyangiaceae bacterium]MCW5788948.1 sel1 repeat family protein [Polyangiaceae bacterium]